MILMRMKREEESSESLSEEEELEQFIDSIQPKDKRNPCDIVPREKSLTDDEKKLFTYFIKVPGNAGTTDQCTLRCADGGC